MCIKRDLRTSGVTYIYNAMPDSAAERAARYRAKHGTRINKNRVLNRVKGGSLPTWNSMEKYDIGLPAINTIKNETKQPLIYEPNQLSEERGKPMKEHARVYI